VLFQEVLVQRKFILHLSHFSLDIVDFFLFRADFLIKIILDGVLILKDLLGKIRLKSFKVFNKRAYFFFRRIFRNQEIYLFLKRVCFFRKCNRFFELC